MEEDRIDIEAPEHVRFSYQVAGIGSRFLAALLDYLSQTIIFILLTVLFAVLTEMFPALGQESTAVTVVIISSLAFLALGYFILFEMIWNGQTPGKRAAGIRVIRDNGTPITITESLIRNILRIIDGLPIAYGVGILSILLSKRSKRIGDFAAGTVVVRDAPAYQASPPPVAVPPDRVQAVMPYLSSLSEQDIVAIEHFIERRYGIDPRIRYEMAQRLAAAIRQKLGPAAPAFLPPQPEALLELFYAAAVRQRQRF